MRKTIMGWNRCYRCGKKLSKTEKEYYGNTCEKCENKMAKSFWKA